MRVQTLERGAVLTKTRATPRATDLADVEALGKHETPAACPDAHSQQG